MSLPVTWLRGLGALGILGGVCLFSLAEAAPVDSDAKREPPAEQIRKALDKPITLKAADQTLNQAIASLRDQAKINIVLDRLTIGRQGWSGDEPIITVELEHVKLRAGLRAVLGPLNLTYVIANGALVITSEDMAVQRQMQQRVSVNLDKVPLKTALQQLAQETAVNLIIDARMAKEVQNPVSLHLEDVPLELTVRLLAEMADLSLVRLDNVLIVTDEARAEKLRAVAAEQFAAWPGAVQFNPAAAQAGFGRARGGRGGAGGMGMAQPGLPPQKAVLPPLPAKEKQ